MAKVVIQVEDNWNARGLARHIKKYIKRDYIKKIEIKDGSN